MNIDLGSVPLFSAFSDDQVKRVVAGSHTFNLREGQPLFEAGDPAGRFFLVVRGQVKLFRLSTEGNEKIIDIIQSGNTFAEALMFLDQPTYPVSAAALGDAVVISFDNRRFLDQLRDSVETCFRLLGTMSQRLRGLIKEIDDLTLQSATSRISSMLLRHLQRAGASEFTLYVPKGVLASRLSVKPETFSRILHNLTHQGVIRVRGNHITVRNREALQKMAHLESLIGLEEGIHQNPCPLTGPKKV